MMQEAEIGEAWFRRDGRRVRHVYLGGAWVPAGDPAPEEKAKPLRPALAERYEAGEPGRRLAQPKLDGIRCLASRDGLFSREGNRLDKRPEIEAELAPIFAARPDLVLDGELWAEGRELREIAAAARYGGRVDLAFHAFDLVSADPAEDRAAQLAAIIGAGSDFVRLVPTTTCETEADLDTHYAECLAAGFEGQMTRDPRAPYRPGRTCALRKRKPREDAEATIISAERRESGRIVLRLRTELGLEFSAPMPATAREEVRLGRMLRVLPGLEATFAFTGLLPCGRPRDAVAKMLHEWPRD